MFDILDSYFKGVPNPQTTIDLFENEWSSKVPEINGSEIKSGGADLFNDGRIKLLNDIYSLCGKTILELGPLEGAHTYMIAKNNAKEVIAVESNSRAFLKCLIIKELFKLNNAHFLFGDAISYMNNCNRKFDLCLSSGILYHSPNPGKFINAISQVSDRVFIWTHFYDYEPIKKNESVLRKFKNVETETLGDYTFEKHIYVYGEALGWKGFCGGSSTYTTWITKPTLIKLLEVCGFTKTHILFEDITHQNGPNLCLFAEKN